MKFPTIMQLKKAYVYTGRCFKVIANVFFSVALIYLTIYVAFMIFDIEDDRKQIQKIFEWIEAEQETKEVCNAD